MDKNLKNCSSYSDLFEDFFRTDSGQSMKASSCGSNELFTTGFEADNNEIQRQQQQIVQVSDFAHIPTDQAAMDFYLQQQAAFYQAASYPAYPPSNPPAAGVHKPGFVRNRTRRNMRQKSVANAVRASHILNAQGGAQQIVNVAPVNVTEYQFLYQQAQAQMQQQQMQQQIPYYQSAAQIPTYHQQQQQQQAVLLAKSPVTQQPPFTFTRSSLPNSPSARSPNSNSSDYVKMKLQQKIRSRMVSKGQIPPNPTEEELRMCGIQVPQNQQQLVTPSQLPTPKSSPQQIPRSFNNNSAAFIAAPMMIPNQLQQDSLVQDDLMKYFDLNNSASAALYSQKDPLCMATNVNNTAKPQKITTNPQSDFIHFNQQQQQQQPQENGSVNYDQFFSDFILY